MQRDKQKEKRRKEILEKGLDLFIHKGYAATKTKDIAKAVGMSEGLLFHYFETKEKLYLELINIAVGGKNFIIQSENDDPLSFFENAAKIIIDYIIAEPFAAKLFVLMNQAQSDENIYKKIHANLMRKNDMEKSVELIKKGQKLKTIRDGDPIALAMTFWMSIQGIAECIARNPAMPHPKSEWIVDILRSK